MPAANKLDLYSQFSGSFGRCRVKDFKEKIRILRSENVTINVYKKHSL
jgi:hypothetical protein